MQQPNEIVNEAIIDWNPRQIVILFSGGYDSMVLAHVVSKMRLDLPVSTLAIDTLMSADGWTEYISEVAEELQFPDFHIYRNESGFLQYVAWVTEFGCPRNRTGHKRAYARLKERAIDATHMIYKQATADKTLFLSGIRQSESRERSKLTEPIQRMGSSNKIFANPLFYWSDEDVVRYRIENDLPDNPFYSTVSGSGDCQCNWGNFITLGTLQIHSPRLANGNVALINRLSLEHHNYGWDGTPNIEPLFDMDEYLDLGLCNNCTRQTGKIRAIENTLLQRGV